jgi:hypothetical protein
LKKSTQTKKESSSKFLYEAPSNLYPQIDKLSASFQSDSHSFNYLNKSSHDKTNDYSRFQCKVHSNSSPQINQIPASFQSNLQFSNKIRIEKLQKTGNERIQIESPHRIEKDKTHTD